MERQEGDEEDEDEEIEDEAIEENRKTGNEEEVRRTMVRIAIAIAFPTLLLECFCSPPTSVSLSFLPNIVCPPLPSLCPPSRYN